MNISDIAPVAPGKARWTMPSISLSAQARTAILFACSAAIGGAGSNVYWAINTPIPAIQHVAAQDWADLWAIPLFEASNR